MPDRAINQPGLADLDAFVAVARARGFRGAASLGGVSASTLSEAVRRLEAQLGVRLLNRTTRSVTPTQAGERLLQRLAPALGEVAAALGALGDGPAGVLRLNVAPIVARLVLPPIVGPFLAAHPGVTLEVTGDDSFIDVLAAGFDAGVRYEERLERDMIAVPIGPRRQRFAAAASAGYLQARGVPAHPEDLLGHLCIRHRFNSGAMPAMEFERNGQVIRVTPAGPLITNDLDVALGAALDDAGIIYSFEALVAPALASGALLPVMQDWWLSFSGPFLYFPSRKHLPPPLRAFVNFVARSRPGAG